jgi:hypothetical protein
MTIAVMVVYCAFNIIGQSMLSDTGKNISLAQNKKLV